MLIDVTRRVVSLLVACLCAGCVARTTRPAEPKPASDPDRATSAGALPAGSVIRLRCTSCLGDCPVFELEVDAGGHVRFTGESFVEVRTAEAHVDPGAVAELWDRLAVLHRDARGQECYTMRRTATGTEVDFGETDHPSTIVEVAIGEVRWELDVDNGCANSKLVGVANAMAVEIIETTKSAAWIDG